MTYCSLIFQLFRRASHTEVVQGTGIRRCVSTPFVNVLSLNRSSMRVRLADLSDYLWHLGDLTNVISIYHILEIHLCRVREFFNCGIFWIYDGKVAFGGLDSQLLVGLALAPGFNCNLGVFDMRGNIHGQPNSSTTGTHGFYLQR